jgi:hypothetical protein
VISPANWDATLKGNRVAKSISVHEQLRGEWGFHFWVEATNADGTATSREVSVSPPR